MGKKQKPLYCESCRIECEQRCANCGKVNYCSRECQKSNWRIHKRLCGPFQIRRTSGKGMGLFAIKDLKEGDLVIREKPIMYFRGGNPSIIKDKSVFQRRYDELPRVIKNRILALSGGEGTHTIFNNKEWETACKIYLCNAIVANGYKDSGLYEIISRVNHSCAPNAEWSYTSKGSETKELRAIKRIDKDEEIVANYIVESGRFAVTKQRKILLGLKFGFSCKCRLCKSDHSMNDALRLRLQKLSDEIQPLEKAFSFLHRAASVAMEICEIIENCEDLLQELPTAYLELYEILIRMKLLGVTNVLDRERVEYYRSKAWSMIERNKLAQSKDAYNRRMQNLEKFQCQSHFL